MDFDFTLCSTIKQLAVMAGASEAAWDDLRNPSKGSIASPRQIAKRKGAPGSSHRVVYRLLTKQHVDAYRNLHRRLRGFFMARTPGFPSVHSHGFLLGSSTKSNAAPHCGSKHLLRMDIDSFFACITRDRITSLLMRLGITTELASCLADVLTHDGRLVEGFPTSPLVANLVAHPIDCDVEEVLKKQSDKTLRYTRYCDDLAVSSCISPPNVAWLHGVIERHGFRLNAAKTRMSKPGQAHFVTGLSVNGPRPRVPKRLKRRLRQQAYYCKKFGLLDHAAYEERKAQRELNNMWGRLAYIAYIEPHVSERYRPIIQAAAKKAGLVPHFPAQRSFLTKDVVLCLDEANWERGWGAVCAVGFSDIGAARLRASEFLRDNLADPFVSGRGDVLRRRGVHFADNHPELQSEWIKLMSRLHLRAYVAFARRPLDDSLYEELVRRLFRALAPWPDALSVSLIAEERSMKRQQQCLQAIVEAFVPGRPTEARVASKMGEIGLCYADYFLGVLGRCIGRTKGGDEQDTRRFERLRDQYRLVIDVGNDTWYSRKHPIDLSKF